MDRTRITQRSQNWKRNKPTSQLPRNSYFLNKRKGLASQNYVTQLGLHGGKLSPPSNPPDVQYQPWNRVTLCFTSAPKLYTLKMISDTLKFQIDPNGNGLNQMVSSEKRFRWQLKIFKVTVWNLTGKIIALSATDPTDKDLASGNRDQLCGIVDTGTSDSTARIGYLYPSSIRSRVFRPDDQEGGSDFFQVATSSSKDTVLYHIELAYKFDGPTKPVVLKFVDAFTSVLNSERHLKNSVTAQEESLTVLKSLNDITQRMERLEATVASERPSTLTKIVAGVAKTALLVAGTAAVHSDNELPSTEISELNSEDKIYNDSNQSNAEDHPYDDDYA